MLMFKVPQIESKKLCCSLYHLHPTPPFLGEDSIFASFLSVKNIMNSSPPWWLIRETSNVLQLLFAICRCLKCLDRSIQSFSYTRSYRQTYSGTMCISICLSFRGVSPLISFLSYTSSWNLLCSLFCEYFLAVVKLNTILASSAEVLPLYLKIEIYNIVYVRFHLVGICFSASSKWPRISKSIF
jgi:hypothetical protein